MSQKELADRLGVDPSQISRDERQEYYGVTLERLRATLKALGFSLSLVSEVKPLEEVREEALSVK